MGLKIVLQDAFFWLFLVVSVLVAIKTVVFVDCDTMVLKLAMKLVYNYVIMCKANSLLKIVLKIGVGIEP